MIIVTRNKGDSECHKSNKSISVIRLQKKGKQYIIIIWNLVVDGNLHFKRGPKLKFTEKEFKPTEVWL